MDSVVIFSKLETGSFPDMAEVVAVVERVASGEDKPTIVTAVEQSWCTIL